MEWPSARLRATRVKVLWRNLLLHWSRHVSQKQDIMWRPLPTSGRERVLVRPMNAKRVVAEKQRACLEKMHGQMKDVAGCLLLSIGTKYQRLFCFPFIFFQPPTHLFWKVSSRASCLTSRPGDDRDICRYLFVAAPSQTFVLLLNNDLLVDSSVRRASAAWQWELDVTR